jgi:hypothetical protein
VVPAAPVEVAAVEVVGTPPEPVVPVDVVGPAVLVPPESSFVEQDSNPTTSVATANSAVRKCET